ncbi:Sugar transport protein 13 [Nymphaea thermarum]|nr:Sugar transport protein 13 [Nymphaea thermarum]
MNVSRRATEACEIHGFVGDYYKCRGKTLAAGFSTPARTEGVQFEGKITPIVIVSCIMAATGRLMFGDDVVISVVMVYFLDVFVTKNLLITLGDLGSGQLQQTAMPISLDCPGKSKTCEHHLDGYISDVVLVAMGNSNVDLCVSCGIDI